MKKRAQVPDAHTFTILFRGFSWNVHHGLSLERTLAIYHSMFSENSPVKPSIIHTNAVLKVCALANNIDAVFGVAARLPTTGRAAPDKLSFTTILNAIKNQAIVDSEGEKDSASLRERQNQAVLQGIRIWAEVKDRWSKGDLAFDEDLVCAMGRLLLIGHSDQDYGDVLALLEQTMNIPRQTELKEEESNHVSLSKPEAADQAHEDDPECIPLELASHSRGPTLPAKLPDAESDEQFETADIINPLAKYLPERYRVHPGPNALSLAVQACTALHRFRAAQDYWGLLTSPEHFNIVPDADNYHTYLRLLRAQRASRLALEIVQEMQKSTLDLPTTAGREKGWSMKGNALQPKTFRIALSCCVRDQNNHNALGHAEKLVRIMMDTLE